MGTHVVVGAGPVGTTTAELLAAAGHEVVVVTRSGRGPRHPGILLLAADAADIAAVTSAAAGADALYNCVNPPYDRWAEQWPPMAAGLLGAAERTGAVLVTMSNVYGYGPVDGPMTEELPLAATFTNGRVRAEMWHHALAAHEAGRARVTEARAADFFGPQVTQSSFGDRLVPKALAGKGVKVLGSADVAHSVTYMGDVARALVVLGTDERALGRSWHVPTNPARTQREMVAELCRVAGVEPVKVGTIGRLALRAAGLFVSELRPMTDVLYQFERPFVVDSSAFTATFGLEPTSLDDALAATADWYRQRAGVAAAA
jgi:nucleoside-diphosphate-sugar epimerase